MKYAIFGNYGHSNIGDEAILRGILSILKDKEVVVYTDSLKNSLLIHGEDCKFELLKTPLRKRYHLIPLLIVQLFLKVLKNKVILVGGGGLFNQINKTAFIQYFLIVLFSRILFKKVIIIGVSVGPLNSKLFKILLKTISLCASEVYVRDTSSLRYFNTSKATLIPDLSLGAKINPITKNSNYFKIAISLMDITKSQNTNTSLKYLEKIESFVRVLNKVDKEIKVEFIAMDFERDLSVIYRMRDRLLDDSIKCGVVVANNFNILNDVFQNADFILATRLHSAILSVLYEKPFMAISYQSKVKDYFCSHDLDEVIINIADIEDVDLYQTLKIMIKKCEETNYLSDLRLVSMQNLQHIAEEF